MAGVDGEDEEEYQTSEEDYIRYDEEIEREEL